MSALFKPRYLIRLQLIQYFKELTLNNFPCIESCNKDHKAIYLWSGAKVLSTYNQSLIPQLVTFLVVIYNIFVEPGMYFHLMMFHIWLQWAFGVTLWELMTLGQQPYADIDPFEMAAYLKEGYRISQPINCPDEL